jgi:signal transduction histidine kinase
MGPASVLQLVFAVCALLTGATNLWLWRERRHEPTHFWLAVASAAVTVLCVGKAMLYESGSSAEAELWQRIMFAASAPLIVGFLRFSFHFLEEWHPAVDRIGLGLGAAGAFLALCTPLVIAGPAELRDVPGFSQRYLEAGMDLVGLALFFAYGVLFSYLIWLYGQHLARLEEHALAIFATLCIWAMCATHDMAVTLRLYSGIYLLGLGYFAFLVAFSGILVRRFVRAGVDVELWAETLQREVDERTAELRQKEFQLADGERLATLSTLAASCAHELNNPAAYVTSSLNRIAELWKDGREEDEGEFAEILAECREGVERIRTIVGELVALARRSDGERGLVDLCEVVDVALPAARAEARFRVEIVPELHAVPAVRGDSRLLGQAVIQLLLNGIHAAAGGRSARPCVGVETSFEDGSIWLVVRDNGPGIPRELRPRLFDPFFPPRSDGDRVGFGLAVTHQIVTSHGGRIDVESSESGTTMVVELPAASEAAAPQAGSIATPRSGRGL